MKNLMKNCTTTFKTFITLSLLSAAVGTYGDDTEVFYSLNVSKPNLLFVLDVSGSMSSNLVTIPGVKGTKTLVRQIITSSDDGFQAGSSGTIILDGTSYTVDNYDALRFRFTNIDIPKGAEIKEAYIQFESTAKSDSNNAHFDVYAEATDNAPPAVASYFGGDYYQDDKMHLHDKWKDGERSEDTRVEVKNVTKDVIERDGWSAGNAIAFHIESNNGARTLAMFDHPTAAPPELHIEYEIEEIKKESPRSYAGILEGCSARGSG